MLWHTEKRGSHPGPGHGKTAGRVLWLLGCALIACTGQKEQNLVARVGDREITIAQYREFFEDLPERLRSEKPGMEGHLEHLQSLIDTELLLIEAKAQGLDQDEDFLRLLKRRRDRGIADAFFRQEVRATIEVTEEDLRAHFVATGRDREVKLEILNFDTEGEARSTLEKIRQGVDFAALVQQAGTPDSAAAGIKDGFLGKDRVHARLRDAVFALALGEVSEPLPIDGRYMLIKVIDERAAEFEPHRKLLRSMVKKEKSAARKQAVLQELETRYEPTLNPAGLERFRREAAYGMAGISPDAVLCEYKGGAISSGRLLGQIKNRGLWEMDPGDSSRVMDFVRQVVIPEELVLAEARHLGLGTEIIAELEEKKDQLLGEELLRRVVKRPVQVTYEEARAYYDNNLDLFASPEYLEMQEILVETEEEARALLEQVQNGSDMEALAAAHTLRPKGKNTGGKFHLHRFEAPLYGGLVEAAEKAPQDQLQGPVPVEEGYSIFRVLGRNKAQASFEDKRMQFRVKNIVTRIKQNERFYEFVAHLRAKYDEKVHIFERNLRLVATLSS